MYNVIYGCGLDMFEKIVENIQQNKEIIRQFVQTTFQSVRQNNDIVAILSDELVKIISSL